jgi:PHP family Zn ribbon phosphoesterase
MKDFEKIEIDGVKYVVLGTNDDGRVELVDDTRLDYAVGMFAFPLTCPKCGKAFYVLDDGKVTSGTCPACGEEVPIERP